MSKSITFNEFVNIYTSKGSQQQNIVYIGIGTAANAKVKNYVLKENDQQQYLPFLQNIKSIFPNIHIHLVLIDPVLNNPPYCVQPDARYFDHLEDTNPYSVPINEWIRDYDYDNVYHDINKITVYTIKESVYYKKEDNIIDELKLLNDFIKNNNDILLFHDFTGRDTYFLSYMFDKELEGCKNRIIYDITLRFDGTCYVDLLNELYFLNIDMHGDDISFLNPFNLDNKEIIKHITETSDNNYKDQLMVALNNKIRLFTDKIYPFYRKYYALHDNITNNKLNRDEVNNILSRYSIDDILEISIFTGYDDISEDLNFITDEAYINMNIEDIRKRISYMLEKFSGYLIGCVAGLLSTSCENPQRVAEQVFTRLPFNPYKWADIVKDCICTPLKYKGIELSTAPFVSCYL